MLAYLAVTCHLHFWQNDRGLLRATAVTRGWNGYRNKSQHRKLKIIPPLLRGLDPATFRSRVRRSNHLAIPAPSSSFLLLLIMKLLPSCRETDFESCAWQGSLHKGLSPIPSRIQTGLSRMNRHLLLKVKGLFCTLCDLRLKERVAFFSNTPYYAVRKTKIFITRLISAFISILSNQSNTGQRSLKLANTGCQATRRTK